MKPTDENVEQTENLRVNLLTQEIKFAKMLAGNTFDGALKEKHIEKLALWLKNRASCTEAFTDKDCMRIWKGLFYSMWMSDKPLPQENLANKIAGLLHTFDQFEVSVQFFAAFLRTMANEWNSIDQWRIDKFMMLVRKVTREMLRVIENNNWIDESIEKLNDTLKKTVLGTEFHVPRGLFMHFAELFFEEVAKVSAGELDTTVITKLLKPFMFYVASQSDYKLIQFVVRSVFNHLLFQSESGREYKEKFDAWKSMNFPGQSINDLVREELDENGEEENGVEENGDEDDDGMADEEDEETGGALDPRAGRVDVVMHEIKFDPLEIVEQLEELKYKKFTRVRNRKCIDRIVTTYKKFAGGIFPIGIQKLKVTRDDLELPDVDEKADELVEFENELYGKQRELKKINKRKRKKIVSNKDLFDEFQAKSNKIAKIKHEANVWKEEDISVENSESTPAKKKKKSKKRELKESNDENIAKKQKKNSTEWEKPLEDGEVEYFIPSKKQQLNGVPRVTKTADSTTTLVITPPVDEKSLANGTEENVTPKKSPKAKKIKSNDDATSIVSISNEKTPESTKSPKVKKSKLKNDSTPIVAEVNSVQHTPESTKSPKVKKSKLNNATPIVANSIEKTPESSKSPKVKKSKLNNDDTPVVAKVNSIEKTPESSKSPKTPKSTDQKVKSTSKLAQSKTSTPNIFADKPASTPSSEKKVKIALKMNKSQEVTEYIRQLKQSPHPYDSAKKPSKGVLKPNLAPSPINPFYKRLIGLE